MPLDTVLSSLQGGQTFSRLAPCPSWTTLGEPPMRHKERAQSGLLRSATVEQTENWVDRAELYSSFRCCDSLATTDATDPQAWRSSMGFSGGHVAVLPRMHPTDGAAGTTSAPRTGAGLRRFTLGASHLSMCNGGVPYSEF